MGEVLTLELKMLAEVAASRKPPLERIEAAACVRDCSERGPAAYANVNERLGIDFTVEKMPFSGLQTMDPRIVRIAPGRNNERHRHAHETLFVIVEGSGEVLVGEERVAVKKGDVAFIPRWAFHQTTNTGDSEFVILAITDFGFTSAVLGDYDRRTRLREGGDDAVQEQEERT